MEEILQTERLTLRELSMDDLHRNCWGKGYASEGAQALIDEAFENLPCPCRRKKCARFGDCRACRAHHEKQGDPPYCERKAGKRRGARKQEGLRDE